MNKDYINQVHKEIDLIQNIISRMGLNSFSIKSGLITILMAIIVFAKEEIFINNNTDNTGLYLTSSLFLPILGFWYLDAFFLKTEKMYRNLYQWIVENRGKTSDYLYDLNTFNRVVQGEEMIIEKPSHLRVMFSKTLLIFYLIPIIFVIGLLVMRLL